MARLHEAGDRRWCRRPRREPTTPAPAIVVVEATTGMAWSDGRAPGAALRRRRTDPAVAIVAAGGQPGCCAAVISSLAGLPLGLPLGRLPGLPARLSAPPWTSRLGQPAADRQGARHELDRRRHGRGAAFFVARAIRSSSASIPCCGRPGRIGGRATPTWRRRRATRRRRPARRVVSVPLSVPLPARSAVRALGAAQRVANADASRRRARRRPSADSTSKPIGLSQPRDRARASAGSIAHVAACVGERSGSYVSERPGECNVQQPRERESGQLSHVSERSGATVHVRFERASDSETTCTGVPTASREPYARRRDAPARHRHRSRPSARTYASRAP